MRPSRLLGCLLVAAALLAACSGDEATSPDGSGAPEAPERGAPAPGEARVVRLAGEVAATGRDGISPGDTLAEGAEVRLADGAVLELGFHDGASLVASGPARILLTLLRAQARRIDLVEGRIGWLRAGETVTGVHTPLDAFVAAQDSTISVEVTDAGATFELIEGTDAKVVHAGRVERLETGVPWAVQRRR